MTECGNFIEITNTRTGKRFIAKEQPRGDYTLNISPSMEVEKVRKRSIGKRIREFMKENNGKQEKTSR